MSSLGTLGRRTQPQRVTIGQKVGDSRSVFITLDASVNEVHQNEAEITEHPVEQGSNISDHVRRKPNVLEIEGVISNNPIAVLASETQRGIKGGPISTKDADAHDEMLRWQEEAVVLFVSTSLRDYENMILTGLSVSRNPANGEILRASMTFREIILATTELRQAPDPVNRNDRDKTKKGRKNTKDAEPEVSNNVTSSDSAIADGINSVGKWLG